MKEILQCVPYGMLGSEVAFGTRSAASFPRPDERWACKPSSEQAVLARTRVVILQLLRIGMLRAYRVQSFIQQFSAALSCSSIIQTSLIV